MVEIPRDILGEKQAKKDLQQLLCDLDCSMCNDQDFENEIVALLGPKGFGRSYWIASWHKILENHPRLHPVKFSYNMQTTPEENLARFCQALVDRYNGQQWKQMCNRGNGDAQPWSDPRFAGLVQAGRKYATTRWHALVKLISLQPLDEQEKSDLRVPEMAQPPLPRLDKLCRRVTDLVQLLNANKVAPVLLWTFEDKIGKELHQHHARRLLQLHILFDMLSAKKLNFLWVVAYAPHQSKYLMENKMERRRIIIPLAGVTTMREVEQFVGLYHSQNPTLPELLPEALPVLYDQLPRKPDNSWKMLFEKWKGLVDTYAQHNIQKIGEAEAAEYFGVDLLANRIKRNLLVELEQNSEQQPVPRFIAALKRLKDNSEPQIALQAAIECFCISDYLSACQFELDALQGLLRTMGVGEGMTLPLALLQLKETDQQQLPKPPVGLEELVSEVLACNHKVLDYTTAFDNKMRHAFVTVIGYLEQLLTPYESLPQ